MALAYDNATTSVQSGVTVASAVSHTIGSITNPLLIVGVHNDTTAQSVSSITSNGYNLVKIGRVANGASTTAELWYFKGPSTGVNSVIVTMSGNSDIGITILSYSGADQQGPLDASNTATGSSAAPSITLITTAPNTMVIDIVSADDSGTAGTPGGSQTGRAEYASTWNRCLASEQVAATTGSYTNSWTTANTPWAVIVASFKSDDGLGRDFTNKLRPAIFKGGIAR